MSGPAAWSSRRPRPISSQDRAVAEDEDPVGVGGGLGVVGDEDDRLAALGARAPEHVQDLGAGRVVQVAGRLVGEQEGRPVDERAGERHPLLLAGGQLVGTVALLARRGRPPPGRRAIAADSSRPSGSRAGHDEGQAHVLARRERIGTRLKNWKTKPVLRPAELRRRVVAEPADRRRRRGRPRRSVGRSSPPRRWRSVLLPEPDGPITATNSPGSTASDTPRTASTSAPPIR